MANSSIKLTDIPVANTVTLNSKFLSVDANVKRTELITAADLTIYLANTVLYKSQVNTTFDKANAAFNHANLAFDQANAAFNHANLAYYQANSLYTQANSAFIQANAAFTQSNALYLQANVAFPVINAVFSQANSAGNTVTIAYDTANSAYLQANVAYAQANSSYTIGNSAYTQATLASEHANLVYYTANAAFTQSNALYLQANVAFPVINAVFSQANSAGNTVTIAYDTANSAYAKANQALQIANTLIDLTNAVAIYATAVGGYNQANQAFIKANTANTNAANAEFLSVGTVPTARLGAGTANANTYLAGDNTWKTVNFGYYSVRQQFTANANQTSFSVTSGYTVNQVDVYYNGTKLVNGSDVIVNSGTDVVLTTGATQGAIIEVLGGRTYNFNGEIITPVRQQFTATANQTSFSVIGGYTPGQIDVYYNGVKLVNGSEVNVSSGSNVVLNSGSSNNAIVDVVGFSISAYSDVVKKSGDTMTGSLTSPGTISALTLSANTITSSNNITATETITAKVFSSSSDEKLKKNIINIENGLEIIEKLNSVEFEWIDSGKKSYGLIAQDLEKILPDLILEEDYKTVNYTGLIPFLIKSIQELSNKIKDLESK